MKAPTGGFDLRSADDGIPAANVRSGRGKAVLFASVLVGAGAFVLGGWAGVISVGRSNFNTANSAARSVKAEIEGMQKTLGQIGAVMALSQQRLAKDKKDLLTYDPQLIADLEKIKLDPRPNTAKIFRVDYFRLPDADVDKLFNYYYDSIALYAEVETAHQEEQGRRGVAEGVRREVGRRDDEELRRRVRQQRRQADRRQPRRGRRSGLQGRRQGLPGAPT